MSIYEQVFYWIGVISAGLWLMLGMVVFSAWVMNLLWRKFKDGKELMDIISAYKTMEKSDE